MAIGKSCKFKTEGGQGGRRGHSNMTHYERTEILKLEFFPFTLRSCS